MKRTALTHVSLVSALLLTACQTGGTGGTQAGASESAGREPGMVGQAETNAFVEGALSERNPLDIAVLPIEAPAIRRDLPLDSLRESFARGLVKLRYSPLSMDFVDERTVEAGYSPGALSESAALHVVISYWDDGQWRSRGRIDVRADVRMIDPENPDGAPLWGGPIQTTMTVSTRRGQYPTDAAMLEAACEQFAGNVLAHLPPRRPEAE